MSNDKTINRSALGKIVFSDTKKMELLTSIVWPEIKKLILKEFEKYKNTETILVVEAAVLIEAKWDSIFDQVWTLSCPQDVVLQSLM